MAQETIVFTPGGELPPDIMALAEQMKPAGFTLQTLPAVPVPQRLRQPCARPSI